MRSCTTFTGVATLLCFVSAAGAATLYVGPGRDYATPQEAINAASDGDLILVDPVTYTGTAATMLFDGPSNLTIRGNGGRPILDMGSNHQASLWGKGISTASPLSSNITYDNLEFVHAAAMDVAPYYDNGYNGAGIRWDGRGLLHVINCYIHDNEEGMLITSAQGSDVVIENCVLCNNGSPLGKSSKHNIYSGSGGEGGINDFVLQYSWSYNALTAYDVKTSARTVKILYNRLGDEVTNINTTPPTTGGGEGIIDVPKGGLTYIMGNLIIKGFTAINGTSLRYGEEGVFGRLHSESYILYNTFIGERQTGANTFISVASGCAPSLVANNFFVKYNDGDTPWTGSISQIAGLPDVNAAVYEHQGIAAADVGMVNYNPTPADPWIDAHLVDTSVARAGTYVPGDGVLPAEVNGFSLTPVKQYVQASAAAWPGSENRSSCDSLGAYELNNSPSFNEAPIVTAGSSAPPVNAPASVPNRPVPLTGATLMCVASDDGLPSGTLTYTWSPVSGPGTVSFYDANAASTTADFSQTGVYTVQVEVSDGVLSTTATETVYAEQPPTVTAGPDQTIPWLTSTTTTVNLTATATDDGLPNPPASLTYSWGQVFTPLGHIDVGFSPGNATSTTASFTGPGTYVVQFLAYDGAPIRTEVRHNHRH